MEVLSGLQERALARATESRQLADDTISAYKAENEASITATGELVQQLQQQLKQQERQQQQQHDSLTFKLAAAQRGVSDAQAREAEAMERIGEMSAHSTQLSVRLSAATVELQTLQDKVTSQQEQLSSANKAMQREVKIQR